MRALLDDGADVDGGENNPTPLQLAIYGGHVAVARLLIERGARTEGRGIQHALAWAYHRHHLEVVELLEMAGVKRDPDVSVL